MAKSTIKTLPPKLLEQLQEWLRDPRITQEEATERLNELLEEIGEKPRSKSAVNRYAMEMAEVGAQIQETREVAKMMMGKLGNEPQGETGRMINEMVRNLIFKLTLTMSKADELDPKAMQSLATSIEKLEKATTINEKRQREIEQRILEKAAAETEKAVVQAGLSNEKADEIKLKNLRN